MPDLFDSEEINRDRRFADEATAVTEPAETPQTVLTQTLSPQEHMPENHSATPTHPERHVGTNRMHIFSAYCERPEAVTFETQEEDETILLLLRKSFITNIPWLVLGGVFAIIPFIIIHFIPTGNTPLSLISGQFVFVLLFFYYLVILSYMLVSFITWYFNTSLITSKRIVDIDFSDLVYKNIAETKMDLVQDVSFTEAGVIRTLFNYGDVLVQTAGALDNFDLHAVPHPDRTVDIIETLIGKGRVAGA